MKRLRDFVLELVAIAERLRDPDPRVFVSWRNPDGSTTERQVEEIFWDSSGRGRVLLHVPIQYAGTELEVTDESDAPAIEPAAVLAWAIGERGCACPDADDGSPAKCMGGDAHPLCRERLKAEHLARVRAGDIVRFRN